MKFALVAAACEGNGIGINNKLPWKIKYALIMIQMLRPESEAGLRVSSSQTFDFSII